MLLDFNTWALNNITIVKINGWKQKAMSPQIVISSIHEKMLS